MEFIACRESLDQEVTSLRSPNVVIWKEFGDYKTRFRLVSFDVYLCLG